MYLGVDWDSGRVDFIRDADGREEADFLVYSQKIFFMSYH
jgi:hypothetical protein